MKQIGNALQGFADGFGSTVAPGAYQAATQRRQTNALGNALSQGDYSGAAKQAFEMGDIGGGLELTQYQDQRQAAQEQQLQDREREFLQRGVALGRQMLNIPAERRADFMAQNWGQVAPYLGDGMSFEQFMAQNGPEAFSDQGIMEDIALAEGIMGNAPERVEGKVVNGRLVNPYTADVMGDFSDPEGPLSPQGKLYADLQAGRITPEQYQAELQGTRSRGTTVNVMSGSPNSPQFAQIPIGSPVPEGMLGGVKIPDGMYAVRSNDPGGFRFDYVTGSPEAREVQSAEANSQQQNQGTATTIGNLISAYADLDQSNAITSRTKSRGENIAGAYASSPMGRMQDAMGLGNIENKEARGIIDGLSMNALMRMISMSDVSARAMDSDAEMRAWLGAIKDDNYEGALTKLHVLDMSFGDGTALQTATQNGIISPDTYNYVINRATTDPMTRTMAQRAQEYARLEANPTSYATGGQQRGPQSSQQSDPLGLRQ